MTLWYVYRLRGDRWHGDWWDEDNPIGYALAEEAQTRVMYLQTSYFRRCGKPMAALPQIIQAVAAPFRKPKPQRKTMVQPAPAEANGHADAGATAMPARKVVAR